jgi:RNA polymerase sigma-70 factor (ECF subfamily)
MNPPRSDKPSSPDARGPRHPEAQAGAQARDTEHSRQPDPPEDMGDPEEDTRAEQTDDMPLDDDSDEAGSDSQHFSDDRVHEDMAAAGTYSPVWGGLAHGSEGRDGPSDAAVRASTTPPPEDDSDAAIMLRVRDGDTSGFTYLIEKHRKQIVHYMLRMTGNLGVAEELAQEVFLRVYRSRESYRAEAKFTTWLYRIATNLGVNYARDHRHEKAAQSVYLDQPDAETGTTPDVADSRQTVEQRMMRDERMAAIRAQVLSLPERQRQAVLMHKYQEMDYREIGAVLKLSESATKSLLFRAYQTLRERLKDYVGT